MLYSLARPLLFALPAETAHHLAFGGLRLAAALPGGRALLKAIYAGTPDPMLRTDALGLSFPTPVGLAAGFDKDAVATSALLALGFGFVEAGTITADAQPGNPRPRMFRLPPDRALVNRLGFNNGGAERAARMLAARDPRHGIVGANVGKTKVIPEEQAAADYDRSTALVAPHADYLVVNVSSPNTPGLRNLQSVEKLEPVLRAALAARDRSCEAARRAEVPALLVKIAPDLCDEDVDAVAELALALRLGGIVATNTTISRAGLRTEAARVEALGAGGLSGAPVKDRALAVMRRLRARVGARMVLVGVGGIETADDAWARIRAGATLVQLYTGFVYGGPDTPARIARGLVERARAAGLARVSDAVGLDVPAA